MNSDVYRIHRFICYHNYTALGCDTHISEVSHSQSAACTKTITWIIALNESWFNCTLSRCCRTRCIKCLMSFCHSSLRSSAKHSFDQNLWFYLCNYLHHFKIPMATTTRRIIPNISYKQRRNVHLNTTMAITLKVNIAIRLINRN